MARARKLVKKIDVRRGLVLASRRAKPVTRVHGTAKPPVERFYGTRVGMGLGFRGGIVPRARRAIARRRDRKKHVETVARMEMPQDLQSIVNIKVRAMFDKRWGKKFAAFNSILIPINAIAPTTLNKVALGLVSVGFLCGASEFIRGGRKERLYDSEIENRIRNSKTPRIRELREKYDNWFVVGKKDRRFKHPIKNPRYRFELVFTNEPQRLIDTLTGKRKRRT